MSLLVRKLWLHENRPLSSCFPSKGLLGKGRGVGDEKGERGVSSSQRCQGQHRQKPFSPFPLPLTRGTEDCSKRSVGDMVTSLPRGRVQYIFDLRVKNVSPCPPERFPPSAINRPDMAGEETSPSRLIRYVTALTENLRRFEEN